MFRWYFLEKNFKLEKLTAHVEVVLLSCLCGHAHGLHDLLALLLPESATKCRILAVVIIVFVILIHFRSGEALGASGLGPGMTLGMEEHGVIQGDSSRWP